MIVAAVVWIRGRRRPTLPANASPSARPRLHRLPLVDSLRAIAALSVLLYRASGFSSLNTVTGVGPYLQHLDVGVAVFFVISGLLLYRPFALAHLRETPSQLSGPTHGVGVCGSCPPIGWP